MSGTHINLKLDEICRGCLKEDGVMTSIFHNDIKPNVVKMFESCTSLQVKENDGYPTKMCNSCILRLHESYQFRQMCVESDIAVRTLNHKSEYTDKISSIKSGNNMKLVNNGVCSDGNDEVEDRKCNLFLNANADNTDEIKEENVNENSLDSYECSICSENFNKYQSLKEHQFNVHGCNKICGVCNKSCTSLIDLMEHSCRPVLNKMTVKKYQCKECDKEYTSAHNLQIHMYSHSGVKPYSCEYCGKSFTKVHSLNSHVSLHTGYLSFLCSECGKGFTTSTGLKRHKISHTGERPYKCTICPGSFAASGDLTVHMRSHTGEKPYLCPTCGKAFSRISHLNTHARTHTGEKPYKCLRCDRAFAQSGDLKSHERTHTGEKPYSCSVCKKRFIQSSGLASHMRTHTGEKSYRCLICYKAFSQPSSLARHRRYHNE